MIKKIIFLISLTTFFSLQAQFRKAPYLIYSGDNTTMKIMFQAFDYQKYTIKWGLNEECAGGSKKITENGENDHIYTFIVKSLIPSKKYFYKIIAENNTEFTGSFFAAPQNKNRNVNFYVFGDTRSNTAVQNKLSEAILKHSANNSGFQTFALHTGDWVMRGNCEKVWDKDYFNQNYKNNIKLRSEIPIMGTRGNHELYGCKKQKENLFIKYFRYPYVEKDKTYYCFNYGQVQIFVLDQYSKFNENSEQYKWLIKSLSESEYKWKFILLHAPAWSAGRHSDEKEQIFIQTHIQKLAEKYKVQMIFAGHNHFYAHCLVNGVHHMTLGGGGARLYKPNQNAQNLIKAEKTNHFSAVQIAGNKVIVEVLRLDLSVIETIELSVKD